MKWMDGQVDRMLLYGGSRSGKTFCVTNQFYIDAMRYPDTNQLIVRSELIRVRQAIKQFEGAKVGVLHGWKGKVDWKWYANDHILEFLQSGSRIHFAGMDDANSANKILGREFCRIFLDEGQEVGPVVYNRLETRLSEVNELYMLPEEINPERKLSRIEQMLIVGMNPGFKSHWSYQVFFKGMIAGTRKKRAGNLKHVHLQMNPTDNPILQKHGQKYLSSLRDKPKSERMQFYDGEFRDTNESALFPEIFTRDYTAGPEHMDALAVGVDPAVTSGSGSDQTGIVLAGKKGDILHFFREYTGKHSPNKMAEIVVNLQQSTGAKIIIEKNQGGDYLVEPIKRVSPDANVELIAVNMKKIDRAYPLHSKYNKKEIVHGRPEHLEELETELHTTGLNGFVGDGSPDTMDAAIMAAQGLFPEMRARDRERKGFAIAFD